MNKVKYDVKDPGMSVLGEQKVLWAVQNMPVLKIINQRFFREKPLKGLRLAACLHVTTETANLVETLKAGGAEVALCASNPLSTQDEVAAYLAEKAGIAVYAIKGENNATYYDHIHRVLEFEPNLTMDDGADLVSIIHKERTDLIPEIIGGSEETTTGVIRLRAMEKDGALRYPIIAVNDALTKHLFDNRYGTGQSTIDGILRSTNILLAGATFVVCGYGWCGKGVSQRAKGMGAIVIVCETNPLRALEAMMDGFRVEPLIKAVKSADIIVTVTGNEAVVDTSHFVHMKDGVIIANSGHFNVEINLKTLQKITKSKRQARPFVDEYLLKNGRRINVLGEGRLINLAAAEGHPAAVMDMSFANQALCAEYLVKNKKTLKNIVYSVPKEIDEKVAEMKLASLDVKIDKLSSAQKKYLSSWKEGTE